MAASPGKGIHHSTVKQVSYRNWSFQLVLQLYGPSILSHFFLNHHSKKPWQESHRHPPQLQRESTLFANYIGSLLHIIAMTSNLWLSFFYQYNPSKLATRKLQTERTSGCESNTLHFFSRNISSGARWFHSCTNGKPDIGRRLLVWKETMSRIISIPYLINTHCFAQHPYSPKTLAIYASVNEFQFFSSTTSTQLPSFQICIGLLEEPRSFPFISNRPTVRKKWNSYHLRSSMRTICAL